MKEYISNMWFTFPLRCCGLKKKLVKIHWEKHTVQHGESGTCRTFGAGWHGVARGAGSHRNLLTPHVRFQRIHQLSGPRAGLMTAGTGDALKLRRNQRYQDRKRQPLSSRSSHCSEKTRCVWDNHQILWPSQGRRKRDVRPPRRKKRMKGGVIMEKTCPQVPGHV